MPLSSQDIEVARSPLQLLAFVAEVRARAKADPVERAAGNLRHGYYKEFWDEVVPLATFAVQIYDESHTVQPVLGNQGYDAIVRDARGKIVGKIEIANPIDGRAAVEAAKEIVTNGYSFTAGVPGDEVEGLISIIARVATKKAVKDYSDAVVVFNVSALPPFPGFEARHKAQLLRIREVISNAGLQAKQVFVLFPPNRLEPINA